MNRFAFVALLLSSISCAFGSNEDATENNYKKHWAAHGICASLAWAILVPLAVCSSMLRKELVKAGFSERFWFQLHRALNLTAAALTIIAFALAVFIIRAQDGSAHLREDPHFLVGTVIFAASMIQVTLALFRPHLPNAHKKENKEYATSEFEMTVEFKMDVENKAGKIAKESTETAAVEKKSLKRRAWEINHRIFGVSLLAMAWWQIHSGWILFEEEDFGGRDNGSAFLGVAGGIMGVAVIGKVVQKVREHHA
jgi:hypothetical protein